MISYDEDPPPLKKGQMNPNKTKTRLTLAQMAARLQLSPKTL